MLRWRVSQWIDFVRVLFSLVSQRFPPKFYVATDPAISIGWIFSIDSISPAGRFSVFLFNMRWLCAEFRSVFRVSSSFLYRLLFYIIFLFFYIPNKIFFILISSTKPMNHEISIHCKLSINLIKNRYKYRSWIGELICNWHVKLWATWCLSKESNSFQSSRIKNSLHIRTMRFL